MEHAAMSTPGAIPSAHGAIPSAHGAIRSVAGIGARQSASLAALCEVLARVSGARRPDALATLTTRAQAPALLALARHTGLPLIPIAPEAIAGIATATCSPRIAARFATGSVAEAVALAALGPGAVLATARHSSSDGTATAALALLPESLT
jgi:cobalt-precorrin 5A hydrolase